VRDCIMNYYCLCFLPRKGFFIRTFYPRSSGRNVCLTHSHRNPLQFPFLPPVNLPAVFYCSPDTATVKSDFSDVLRNHMSINTQKDEQSLDEYNVIIKQLINDGHTSGVISKVEQMKAKGIIPNVQTYATLIKMWIALNNEKEILRLLTDMRTNKIEPNNDILSNLLTYFLSKNNWNKANEVYKEMQCRNMKLTAEHKAVMIEFLLHGSRRRQLSSLLATLTDEDINDSKILLLAIKGYLRLHDESNALNAFCMLVSRSDSAKFVNVTLYNQILALLAEFGNIKDALAVFELMRLKGVKPSFLTYNYLLLAYGKAGEWLQCLVKFAEWKKQRLLKPSSYVVMIYVAGVNGQLDMAFRFFRQMIHMFLGLRVPDNGKAFVALIDACLTNNARQRAWEVIRYFVELQNEKKEWRQCICRKFIYCFVGRLLSDPQDLAILPGPLKTARDWFLQEYNPANSAKHPDWKDREQFVDLMQNCLPLFRKPNKKSE
jgi:pentatricopeptide repeat protein